MITKETNTDGVKRLVDRTYSLEKPIPKRSPRP